MVRLTPLRMKVNVPPQRVTGIVFIEVVNYIPGKTKPETGRFKQCLGIVEASYVATELHLVWKMVTNYQEARVVEQPMQVAYDLEYLRIGEVVKDIEDNQNIVRTWVRSRQLEVERKETALWYPSR